MEEIEKNASQQLATVDFTDDAVGVSDGDETTVSAPTQDLTSDTEKSPETISDSISENTSNNEENTSSSENTPNSEECPSTNEEKPSATKYEGERKWYVALVRPRSEKKCEEYLKRVGVETYIASQKEERTWSQGRKKTIERIVIGAMVFVKTTNEQRLQVVARAPYVYRFLIDRCKRNANGFAMPAVISEEEINKLKFILSNASTPVTVEQRHITSGTKVRVMRGSLLDTEGVVLKHNPGDTYLYVELDILGCVKVKMDIDDLQYLDS